MKKVFIAIVKFYQRNISPRKKPCCRFIPTCSAYAIEAFEEWGAVKGLGLTLWRILRCNPFCKSGFDPVPINRKRNHIQNEDFEKNSDEYSSN